MMMAVASNIRRMIIVFVWLPVAFALDLPASSSLSSAALLNVVTPADCTIVRSFVDQQKLVVNEAAAAVTSGEAGGKCATIFFFFSIYLFFYFRTQ